MSVGFVSVWMQFYEDLRVGLTILRVASPEPSEFVELKLFP